MITINQEKCIGCRQCENICHAGSISFSENKFKIDYSTCSTCTQCIAICPVKALSWDYIEAYNINSSILPKSEQIKEFLKERRSIRKFKNKPVEKAILQDIAVMSKYAPTNNYDIDIIIVEDKSLINELEKECLAFINRVYKIIYKPKVIFNMMKKITPAANVTDKIKMERILKRGNIFQNAPALIILIADSRIVHTELSCQYALYNMSLYSEALGLGSCISGSGKSILSKNKKVKGLLNIPDYKKIQGILFLGYPDVNFKNKVEGIKPKIYWNKNNR